MVNKDCLCKKYNSKTVNSLSLSTDNFTVCSTGSNRFTVGHFQIFQHGYCFSGSVEERVSSSS